MTLFRPCIDLHDGKVKQIVGGTLRDEGAGPVENFVADQPAAWFAARYRADGLTGGHVIKLGPGNEEAAQQALAAWPDGMQLGGGVTLSTAAEWVARGAAKVIVTSWLFVDKRLDLGRVEQLARAIGPERLVVDLSCRRVPGGWRVATDRWQTITETPIDAATLSALAPLCSELLVHAADVEGRCEGIDEDLVRVLGEVCPLPCTYAGGGRDIADLERVAELSSGRVDLTYGSALDLFGGTLVKYADCVAWNRQRSG